MEPIADLVKKTLVTLEPARPSPTTGKPAVKNSPASIAQAKSKWISKWVKMNLHHPKLKRMAETLYSFAHGVYHDRGELQGRLVVIYGPNGCGKTHAARALHRWYNAVRISIGPVVGVNSEGEKEAMIGKGVMVNWAEVVDGFKRDQWLITERLAHDYLALIDDIGAEHDPSKIGAEKLYVILNRREFRHTLITTNLPPDGWETRFERRIASRLFRNATHIDLTDVPDFVDVR